MARSRPRKRRRTSSGSGGSLTGLRGGFRGLLGKKDPNKKESLASQIFTYLLMAAAVGFLLYKLLHKFLR